MEVSFEIRPQSTGCNHTTIIATNISTGRTKTFHYNNSELTEEPPNEFWDDFTIVFLKHLAKQNNLTKAQLRAFLVGKTFKF